MKMLYSRTAPETLWLRSSLLNHIAICANYINNSKSLKLKKKSMFHILQMKHLKGNICIRVSRNSFVQDSIFVSNHQIFTILHYQHQNNQAVIFDPFQFSTDKAFWNCSFDEFYYLIFHVVFLGFAHLSRKTMQLKMTPNV